MAAGAGMLIAKAAFGVELWQVFEGRREEAKEGWTGTSVLCAHVAGAEADHSAGAGTGHAWMGGGRQAC
eukprot:6195323-Pleurochrysis_carterae.AAC.1